MEKRESDTQKEGGKRYDRPHLLEAQLTHWLALLPPLAVLVLATVSKLCTESTSTLSLASADLYETVGELGTAGGEGIEGDSGTPAIDMSDVEMVTEGWEEGVDEESDGAGEEVVVVGCAAGFRNCSRAFFARENNEPNPSLIARAPAVLASLRLGGETSNGLGGTTASVGTPTLSLSFSCFLRASPVATCLSRSPQGPAVGTALTVSTSQSAAFCPGGSATTSSRRTTRPVSCSCVRSATGIGNCQLAPTHMHATGVW